MCNLPVEYTLGDFDDRFGISEEFALQALAEAEAVWETSLQDENIFVYRDDAKLKVNFIYDERQQQTEVIGSVKEDIYTRGSANEVLVNLHKKLVAEYESYESTYENKREEYEEKLASYNNEVETYNENGGAPPEVYEELENRRAKLDEERVEINTLADTLNDLADQINSIGDKGNELISEYNEKVRNFNDTYVHEHEYTQGDYRGRVINVYTFDSKDELVLILAHELGHALAIGHVDDSSSVMHYLMGGQTNPPVLTEEDKVAFATSCQSNFIKRLWTAISGV